MWGQGYHIFRSYLFIWIIPTRVGTSTAKVSQSSCYGDHPHACGDKPHYSPLPVISSGSSPRVWGQAHYAQVAVRTQRIIPTRVGTRLADIRFSAICCYHPHACGDKYDYVYCHGAGRGIIPTRVGTRSSSVSPDQTV